MRASYGYRDGSGDYYITVDTDRCTGCGDCVPACPAGVLDVGEDENDPLKEDDVAFVVEAHRRRLGTSCAACKPSGARPALPCVAACPEDAIEHSW